jgi:hypothetical protein
LTEQDGRESKREGLAKVWGNTAPWSDDPEWKIKMRVHRDNYCEALDESEIFDFDHLPVPLGNRTEVNRSITRNGVTLHIGAIERSEDGYWRFSVEGSPPANAGGKHRILLLDARVDRGSAGIQTETPGLRFVGSKISVTYERTTYSLKLPPDAQWWELKLVSDNAETVEFEARSTFIKQPKVPRR